MKTLLISFMLTFNLTTFQLPTLPDWFNKALKANSLDIKYSITPFIKNGLLEVDFNGDKLADVAVLVSEKKTGKKGVLVLHNGKSGYFLFGAGINFGSGSDNFDWAKGWKIYKEQTVSQTQFDNDGNIVGSKEIKLKQSGISIWAEEDGNPIAGGIIYWDGKKYIWIHQGE